MCLMLYVATRDEQPLLDTPAIGVEALAPSAEPVRRWFTLPKVRYVRAHGTCSCGFPHVLGDGIVECFEGMFGDVAGRDADVGSVAALLALLRPHVDAAGEVQLYAVWEGAEAAAPVAVQELVLETLNPQTFFLNENTLCRVTGAVARAAPRLPPTDTDRFS